MGTYGEDVQDVDNNVAMGGYTVMASLATSLAGIEGDITTETVAEAMKSMEESDYPGAADITFQCGGTVFPSQPAVCTNQSLRATLDAEGNLASFEAIDSSDAVEGI